MALVETIFPNLMGEKKRDDYTLARQQYGNSEIEQGYCKVT